MLLNPLKMATPASNQLTSCDINSFEGSRYKYDASDLKVTLTEEGSEIIQESSTGINSSNVPGKTFDSTLTNLWETAMNSTTDNPFRYKLARNSLPFKVLPGNFNYIAQLNQDRAEKRRKPQEIKSLQQPFNPSEFNFNKINRKEILLMLCPYWSHSSSVEEEEHLILINVSPLEYCHVLVTPYRNRNRPQRLSSEGLRLVLEMCLLSDSCDIRFGFNSLCGFASVNHEHFHSYYLSHRLYIEFAPLVSVSESQSCYQFANSQYPPGFCFVLTNEDNDIVNEMNKLLQSVMLLVAHLEETNTAHNLFITRGSTHCEKGHFDSVRVFVWARTPSFGAKGCDAFNPAICELAGHFSIKNEESYKSITEEYILKELHQICDKPFETVRNWIISSDTFV